MLTQQSKNLHVLWRTGFGPSAQDLSHIASTHPNELFNAIEKAAKKSPQFIDVARNAMDGIALGINGAVSMEVLRRQIQDANQRRAFMNKSREAIRSLNLSWLDEMVHSKAQLREKMAFFWHGHFACRNLNIFYQQLLLHEIRQHALGTFHDLLLAVSKSAAMLAFLNNQQNRKQQPNENFAREVMELFTLGRENYSEQDVKEAARAFTGWGFRANGEFVFRKAVHDTGSKTILGKTGNFDGDDVITLLLEQKQTAYFITRKLYRFFVNEKVNEERVKWLAEKFYQGNYHIGQLMKDMFTADWFFEEENVGSRIKSPIELIAGMRRLLPMHLHNDEVQLLMQQVMGQVLFNPPNVAGWPQGKAWIDSSSLLLRMRIPLLISTNDVFVVAPKTDDDQAMGKMPAYKAMGNINERFRIQADVVWDDYLKHFNEVPRQYLQDVIESIVLQAHGTIPANTINQYADTSSREAYIKSITIALMSTPAYQLC